MITEIKSLSDVEKYAVKLIIEGTTIHPDDDFANYVKSDESTLAYSPEEATLRNSLMEKSFIVCAANGIDIYDFMLNIYLRETRLAMFIPMQSELN